MSDLEKDPAEVVGTGDCEGPALEMLEARDVVLGRTTKVRRLLPNKNRRMVGAWCFVDHYGPEDLAQRVDSYDVPGERGMQVPPHPHTSLQTVSWLFEGEIEHRDSAGHHAMVRPGQVNLMTAGRGISHSEISTPGTRTLHGAQLWVALPDADRHAEPTFSHHEPPRLTGDGWVAKVFLGSLLGDTSPVATYTPLVGAEILLEPDTRLSLDVDPSFEHGVLVDAGLVTVGEVEAKPADLAYVPIGSARLELRSYDEPVRLLLLGGPPFGEPIVMWWNFVGRTHEEIVGFRSDWQDQIVDGSLADGHFGIPVGDELPPIPAPDLPNARLKERH